MSWYFMKDHLILTSGWILYCVIHSLLADTTIKKYIYKKTHLTPQRYRMWYNVLAALFLIPVLLFTMKMSVIVIFVPNWYLSIAGTVFLILGVYIGILGNKGYNTKAFLGFSDPDCEYGFSTEGLLSRIRHPWYLASIVAFIGFLFIFPNSAVVLSAVVLTAYIFIGIRLEERKLIRQFGQKYLDYRQRTPMLFPKFRL